MNLGQAASRKAQTANAQQYDPEVVAKRTKRHLDELEVGEHYLGSRVGIKERTSLPAQHRGRIILSLLPPLALGPGMTMKTWLVAALQRVAHGKLFQTSERQSKEERKNLA